MNLKSYFQKNSQADLAKALGVTPGAVSQWASGVAEISAERCIEIECATGGVVRCEDLRQDIKWAVLRAPPGNAQAATEAVAVQGV